MAARGELGPGSVVRFDRTFTARDVAAFGELTRDDNPVHSDPRWCELKGFAGPVCHGLLVGSMICEAGGEWGWLASGMSFRFLRPTYVGETVVCEVRIVELGERGRARAECTMTTERGEVVVTGELEGYLPVGEERERLAELYRGDR